GPAGRAGSSGPGPPPSRRTGPRPAGRWGRRRAPARPRGRFRPRSCFGHVPGPAEQGEDVLVELEPDVVDRVHGRADHVLRLPGVDPLDGAGEPVPVGAVAGAPGAEAAERLDLPLDQA